MINTTLEPLAGPRSCSLPTPGDPQAAVAGRAMLIRLLIGVADGWDGFRDVLALQSKLQADSIACETVPLQEVPARAGMTRPDVVLLEAADNDEIAALLTQLRKTSPASRTLVLYEGCSREPVIQAVRHGAAGCVTRPVEPGLLGKAVRALYLGGDWFGRTDLLQALQSLVNPKPGLPEHKHVLTGREQQILNLAGCGLSNKEIGRRLAISDHTVKTHLHRVYVKLNLSGRYRAFQAQPVAGFITQPLVPPDMRSGRTAPLLRSDFMAAQLPR